MVKVGITGEEKNLVRALLTNVIGKPKEFSKKEWPENLKSDVEPEVFCFIVLYKLLSDHALDDAANGRVAIRHPLKPKLLLRHLLNMIEKVRLHPGTPRHIMVSMWIIAKVNQLSLINTQDFANLWNKVA